MWEKSEKSASDQYFLSSVKKNYRGGLICPPPPAGIKVNKYLFTLSRNSVKDTTNRSEIISDQKRLLFARSLYLLPFLRTLTLRDFVKLDFVETSSKAFHTEFLWQTYPKLYFSEGTENWTKCQSVSANRKFLSFGIL